MHVVDSTLFFAPHSGGVKRYLQEKHAFYAASNGVQHSVLVPGPSDMEDADGMCYMRCPSIPFGGGYRVPMSVRRWRERLVSLSPDVIEAGDPYHIAWAALGAAAKLNIPSVAFAHSNLPRLVECRFGVAAGKAARTYLRALYGRFDLVLAPSLSVANYLREIGIERVAVQGLGVNIDDFHPSRADAALREELNLPQRTRLVAFAGRMAREKRVPWLIRAVEALGAPYHLLLIGGHRTERVGNSVTRLPYQHTSHGLARLLASVDALVHAGDQETFGMVFLEAMACGKPVVGMRCDVVNELIDDEIGRVADPSKIDSLSAAIESLYADDIRRLGSNARCRVERHYTWKAIFMRQLEFYARLHRRESLTSGSVDEAVSWT